MNPLAWLDESLSLRLVQTLLHFLWQGTAIAILACGLEQFLRRGPAQARYVLHVVAMFAMVACLPITFVVVEKPVPAVSGLRGDEYTRAERATVRPSVSMTSIRSPETAAEPGASGSTYEPAGRKRQGHVDRGQAEPVDFTAGNSVPDTHDGTRTEATARRVPSRLFWLQIVAPYVILGYLTCVLAMMARLATAVRGGHQLRRFATDINDTELLTRIAGCAKRLGLRVVPPIAYCERISIPVVVGVTRPMILLPASLLSGLSPDQVEALVIHEMAHLRRYDPLVNLLQRLVEAWIFFHPAVWYISRRINVERENACDDVVLSAGWRRERYADALVRMAELSALLRSDPSAWPATTLAASGGRSSDFRRRVMRLLEREPSNFRLTKAGSTLLLAILLTTALAPLLVEVWAQRISAEGGNKNPSETQDDEQLGRRIGNFRLQDFRGAPHALSDFADTDVLVVAFLGTECPLAKLYGPRLAALAELYQPQNVAFIGINSNQQDTPTELGHYARTCGIAFLLLKDPGNRVADQFRARRTPEVFVLDKERTVRYWGRIDDQFGVGYARPEPKEHYVAAAIDELLAGRPVSTPETEPVGCHIGRVSRVAPSGDITYAKQISRIVQRRCIECHREGGIAPFALDSFDTVAAWAETICEVVEDRRMPPWHASPKYGRFANDGRMPEAEKQLLYQWVAQGVPEGSARDLPPERVFTEGWALGKPDLVVAMPEPITVPPTGVIDYQYVTIDPGFTEGKWVRASETRPGVRSVVHHIIVFINPPGGDPILEERGVGFETVGGYVPGSPPMELEPGVARYVPPGSTLVFQIHYTPDGTERRDQSQIGLYFADPSSVRRTMQTGVAVNLDFEIPPHTDNYRVEAAHRISHDMNLHTLAPHMHYRGKAFRFEATYPNGSREILLDVPRYDFNWQNVYRLAEPKFLPAGTLLKCVAHFDNSEGNLSNPDPSIAVRWGEQTWEEMMIGYFEGVFLNQDLSLPEPEITPMGNGSYRVHFTYPPDRPVKSVNLAGTFNDWNTSSQPLTDADGDGTYTAAMTVPEGAYRYKFVIDGNYWTHDPASRILTGFLHESFFVAGHETKSQRGE